MESETMADFVNNTDRINALADASPGFSWRFEEDPDKPSDRAAMLGSNLFLVNMSVWKDRESLCQYVYQSGHKEIFKRKKEWFHAMPKMHMVLWFIDEDHIPSVEEGLARLEHLQNNGESAFAFSFRSKYTPEDV
jgi:hypothetical protein